MLIKQLTSSNKIASSRFSLEDLRKLAQFGFQAHGECESQFLSDVREGIHIQKEFQAPDYKEAEAAIQIHFKPLIEIFGKRGEYLNLISLDELASEIDLPIEISKITFSNRTLYKLNFDVEPSIYFEITIDFHTTNLFELVSTSTKNDSQILVAGRNSILVNGISSTFLNFFKTHRSFHDVIHHKNTYDIVLWVVFFPLLLVFLFKYSSKIPHFVTAAPIFTQMMAALGAFFLLILSFKLLFNIGQLLFPYMELSSQKSILRHIVKGVYVTIVVTAIINFFSSIIILIFK